MIGTVCDAIAVRCFLIYLIPHMRLKPHRLGVHVCIVVHIVSPLMIQSRLCKVNGCSPLSLGDKYFLREEVAHRHKH